MSWSIANIAVCGIAGLHVLFMLGELLPWKCPVIMRLVIRKWPRQLALGPTEQQFAASIVQNAGIYNGIVAAALFSTLQSADAIPIQVVLIVGGIVAGLFGTATLSKATIAQAVLGTAALTVLLLRPR